VFHERSRKRCGTFISDVVAAKVKLQSKSCRQKRRDADLIHCPRVGFKCRSKLTSTRVPDLVHAEVDLHQQTAPTGGTTLIGLSTNPSVSVHLPLSVHSPPYRTTSLGPTCLSAWLVASAFASSAAPASPMSLSWRLSCASITATAGSVKNTMPHPASPVERGQIAQTSHNVRLVTSAFASSATPSSPIRLLSSLSCTHTCDGEPHSSATVTHNSAPGKPQYGKRKISF